MDTVVAFESGKVVSSGPFGDIGEQLHGFIALEDPTLTPTLIVQHPDLHNENDQSTSFATTNGQATIASELIRREDGPERRQGSWSVYAYYGGSVGFLWLFLWAFFTLLGNIATIYTSESPLSCS